MGAEKKSAAITFETLVGLVIVLAFMCLLGVQLVKSNTAYFKLEQRVSALELKIETLELTQGSRSAKLFKQDLDTLILLKGLQDHAIETDVVKPLDKATGADEVDSYGETN